VNTFAARRILEEIRYAVCRNRRELIDQLNRCSRAANHFLGRQAGLPQLADTSISSTLAQLFSARFENQWMVRKARASSLAEHLPQTKLTPRGRGEIFTANDVGNPLRHVVDGDRELVRPVAVAIAQQQIAALTVGFMLDHSEEKIVERLHPSTELNTQPPARRLC
jgi:hypothetical protein